MGSYEKPTFSDEEKKKFSDFNQLDEDLYQMSNQTFWEKATERPGGIPQLNQDVQNLKVTTRVRTPRPTSLGNYMCILLRIRTREFKPQSMDYFIE